MPEIVKYKLNRAQKDALCHHLGPAMILAGPGSGKTTVLIGRVKHLIEQYKVPPSSILVITYTKAAALSMQHRFIREMKGGVFPVAFGTFHAIYYHILQERYHFRKDSLLSMNEKRRILYSILKDQINTIKKEPEGLDEILSCISLRKNGFKLEELPIPASMEKAAYERCESLYLKQTAALGKMDFDDMLVRCLELFKKEPETLIKWQKRISYILVDEFQDSNKVQYEVLKMLASPQNNLFVVGDDDQSIYGFRGASPGIMQQFEKDYKGLKKVYLEANYRSREEIVLAANSVIIENKNRFIKNMFASGAECEYGDIRPVFIKSFTDREKQYFYLCNHILSLSKQLPLNEMAVIFRTNRDIEYLIPHLAKENIPYVLKEGIKSRYAHFVVQDIAAYLKLAIGESKRSIFLQIMNKPVRYISRDSIWDEEVDLKQIEEQYRNNGKRDIAASAALLRKQLLQIGRLSPFLAINFVRKIVGYDIWLRGKAGTKQELFEEWKELLDEVQLEAKGFKQLSEWLAYIKQEEVRRGNTISQNREGVQLMTMHASKGLEFAYVCIPGVNEGRIPYGKSPGKEAEEEERRLFYVGMTRAKAALEILYLTGTKDHPRLPSRFLNTINKTYSSSLSTSSSNS